MACVLIVKTGDAYPEVVDQYGDFETLFEKQLSTALPAHLDLQVWMLNETPLHRRLMAWQVFSSLARTAWSVMPNPERSA